jgi:hypothetical protein
MARGTPGVASFVVEAVRTSCANKAPPLASGYFAV